MNSELALDMGHEENSFLLDRIVSRFSSTAGGKMGQRRKGCL
jgi:hypothetical protein